HEAIISEELFNHAQALLGEENQNSRKTGAPYHHLPYAGLIECGECRSHIETCHTTKKSTSGWRYFYLLPLTVLYPEGWKACSTRQISAPGWEPDHPSEPRTTVQDIIYLKQMLFSVEANCISP
ncbi:MAG: hypothetical protein IPJ35_09775, partial [Elusimicrobia bacterium]|nr:hypothetical protein [Elusimicrobiota bacterium]